MLASNTQIRMNGMKKPRAVIVGGSIAGLSCAHSLISAGFDVVVIEKSATPPTGSPTGAGLGLDPLSRGIIRSWINNPKALDDITVPITIDENRATDGVMKESWDLTRDEEFNFRAAHWYDLHGLLYRKLPPEVVLWGHLFLSFNIADDAHRVSVKARVVQTDEEFEISGNLLVAADGCLSSIRKHFLPNLKLRYSGYCAWRGILDFPAGEDSDSIAGIRRAYPSLGKCLYFDLSSVSRSHAVLYELLNKRLNWIWYINQPEPELKGNSVTMKVSNDMVRTMHEEAERTWLPELATVMKETKDPFINVIYDCDPLERIVWDNVVLVGDAAHPTTPHGLRSTNMSLVDAEVLGSCLRKWGLGNLLAAVNEYQDIRLPVTSKQVLHARRLGRIKQGLPLPDGKAFDPRNSSPQERQELHQKNMPYFHDVPLHLDSPGGMD